MSFSTIKDFDVSNYHFTSIMNNQANPSLFVPIQRNIRAQKTNNCSLKALINVKPPILGIASKSTKLEKPCFSFDEDYASRIDCSNKLRKDEVEDDENIPVNSCDYPDLLPVRRMETKIFNNFQPVSKKYERMINYNIVKPLSISFVSS